MGERAPGIGSQITFLYYDDLDAAERFYGEVLGFEVVVDQGWAKIYAVRPGAFIGIVGGEKGFHRPKNENAVLVTLVVDDVHGWYGHLETKGVGLLSEMKEVDDIQVRAFFLADPGGYVIEIQQFLDPEVARVFE